MPTCIVSRYCLLALHGSTAESEKGEKETYPAAKGGGGIFRVIGYEVGVPILVPVTHTGHLPVRHV